jgi:hypothetical protein
MADDFYKMSSMMKDLFPSNPQADREALMGMANGGQPQQSAESTKNYVQESVDVPQGSLQMDKNYSVNDFAALAGVTKAQPNRVVETITDQDYQPIPETTDKDLRIQQLEERVSKLEALIKERPLSKGEEKKKEKIVKGMKKNKGDFEKRYGKDAEAVMYATATKNAKKESFIKDELYRKLKEYEYKSK